MSSKVALCSVLTENPSLWNEAAMSVASFWVFGSGDALR